MHRVFQRSSSFAKGRPTSESMPSPLLFKADKAKPKTDSLKTESPNDPNEENNVMGSLDAALHRMAQRRQSTACSGDQRSVHSMIEMRRVPRVMSQSLTMPSDGPEHRRSRGPNEMSIFTVKWNSGETKNRMQSIEFEGDYDTNDWDSDADHSESKSSRNGTSLTLEHALSFRSLAWNPCDDIDDASQSSMSCSSASSTISKSRGSRPRLTRSGSFKDTSSKALEFMQQRSCLQQSLLRVKNKKPKRRPSSDRVTEKEDSEENVPRRMSRPKSDRSKDGSEEKNQEGEPRRLPRRKSHDSSDKTSQHGSLRSSRVSKSDSKGDRKLRSSNKEKCSVKTLDASKSSDHRRSSTITQRGDVIFTPAQRKEHKTISSRQSSSARSSSMKMVDILATPKAKDSDATPSQGFPAIRPSFCKE